MSNAPERYLCWRWEDESEAVKLQYTPDSKKPNAGTFVLGKEDHTMGNLIRIQLLRDPKVRFAAYRMPHPLVFDSHIRVETMDSKSDPISVMNRSL
jgi:DNA-directed RNA polymerase II subunit RPB11